MAKSEHTFVNFGRLVVQWHHIANNSSTSTVLIDIVHPNWLENGSEFATLISLGMTLVKTCIHSFLGRIDV